MYVVENPSCANMRRAAPSRLLLLYGTMSDDEFRQLGVPALQPDGQFFLRIVCLKLWGYERLDKLMFAQLWDLVNLRRCLAVTVLFLPESERTMIQTALIPVGRISSQFYRAITEQVHLPLLFNVGSKT